MRTVVVGAGLVGTYLGVALARRGHEVMLVDRDAGPAVAGDWSRRGVMQFHHPHFFRAQVRLALLAEMPDVWDAIVAAGGVPAPLPGMPEMMTGLACRRSTVERVMRRVVEHEPHVTVRVGHADRPVIRDGRLRGLVVDGAEWDADLVVCAAGRASRFGNELREPALGGPTGFSYVSRMFRARPGAPVPDATLPIGALAPGYQTIVFPQDDRTLSALIVRPTTDDALAPLREEAAYEAAARAIPNLAPWTASECFDPITPVMAGGGLTNTYSRPGGAPAGLIFVGDAVCTTNPAAGRGVALGLRQAQELLASLDDAGPDLLATSDRFDEWCAREIQPWYADHEWWDETLLRRLAGEDIDVEDRLPSDVICATAQVDPSIMTAAGPFLAMMAGPGILAGVEDRAREVLRTGWRPPWAPGPTRDELVDVIADAGSGPTTPA
jgi:2-polyprenyl-6-methoxyphenol hydroxylase-like FAD-dependent oxidoreductase